MDLLLVDSEVEGEGKEEDDGDEEEETKTPPPPYRESDIRYQLSGATIWRDTFWYHDENPNKPGYITARDGDIS